MQWVGPILCVLILQMRQAGLVERVRQHASVKVSACGSGGGWKQKHTTASAASKAWDLLKPAAPRSAGPAWHGLFVAFLWLGFSLPVINADLVCPNGWSSYQDVSGESDVALHLRMGCESKSCAGSSRWLT